MLKMYKKVFMVKINKNVLTLKRSKNRSTSILGTAQGNRGRLYTTPMSDFKICKEISRIVILIFYPQCKLNDHNDQSATKDTKCINAF